MAIGKRDGNDVFNTLKELSELVLHARHEEDFLERLASVLQEHVQCDAVILRLLERHIQTRAVATKDGVHMLSPDELWEPFTQADRDLWMAKAEGTLCHTLGTCAHVKPKFREHAERLGLRSGFIVPIIRDGDICGQVTFAWSRAVTLDESQREQLLQLSDYACLQFTLFNVRQARELDAMTGLLNRLGLRRRWEVASRGPRGILFYVDVTGMKRVADARGQLAADDLVRHAARLLLDVSSPQVAVGRYGANQFVLLAPGMNSPRADELRTAIVDHFDAAVAALALPHVRCAVSVAQWPHDGSELLQLVAAAEGRLYEQKRRRVNLTLTTKGSPRHGRLPRHLVDGWLATSPDGVIVTDQDGKVVYVNPAYELMTGYPLSHWLGKSPGFVASGKTPQAVYEQMWDNLEAEGSWSGNVVNRHRFGREWISSLSITKIDDRSGRPIGFLGVARDVTDSIGGDKTYVTPGGVMSKG